MHTARLLRASSIVAAAALVLGSLMTPTALAAPGDLDTSFSGDGYALTTFAGGGGSFYGVAVRGSAPAGCGQGGIVLVGVRRPGGGLDRTFSGDGRLRIDPLGGGTSYLQACRYLPDGRLVGVGGATNVGGDGRMLVAVFTRNGRPDRSFSGDGFAVTRFPGSPEAYGYDLAVRRDGRIVAVGETYDQSTPSARFAIARFTASGALDRTFSGDGRVTVGFGSGTDGAWKVELDSDGRVVVGGWARETSSDPFQTGIVVLRPDGRRDPRFGDGGKRLYDVVPGDENWANALAIRPDDRIVVGVDLPGAPSEGHAVMQLKPRGGLDLTFGGGDGLVVNVAPEISLEDLELYGRRIVFTGTATDTPAFVRLRELGGL
ncbi:MAG TPA: delta-60 repeat domain-containing protein, partial [Actinomycetota bacterium]